MRRSLLLKLLALSLGVASLAVIATALLATYGTGTQLRDEVDANTSLLETDSRIRDALLEYAKENDGWDDVGQLIRDLAEDSGRRIALTKPDGDVIADSADLLGQGSADIPSTKAAEIDATESDQMSDNLIRGVASGVSTVPYYFWQMTDDERRERQALADEAVQCLGEKGIDATIQVGGGSAIQATGLFVTTDLEVSGAAERRRIEPGVLQNCVPADLNAPSATARAINEDAVEQMVACLDRHELEYDVAADPHDMQIVQPANGGDRSATWRTCEQTTQAAAMRPYVASAADLYLGTTDRFDPFSPQGWWRTAATIAAVLAAAGAVTVLAGRKLVGPIQALTAAAKRMTDGDRAARVQVHGGDEVSKLSSAFNDMAESIEVNEEQRRALVSDVAHELRTPLTNVRMHLEAAEVGVTSLDMDFVRSLREESDLLERLVADLQDLALADAGQLRIHPEEIDVLDVASQAVVAHRPQAEAAGVRVHVDGDGRTPIAVVADPERLRQALGNLVANAVTHTPSGGSVDVNVSRADGVVSIAVTDTGRGIAPEHWPRLFDRFYRADASRNRTTGGSGLGLAITKYLVDAHGGSIDVSSVPDEGSVFTITLPASSFDGGT